MTDLPERIFIAGRLEECGQYFPEAVEAEGEYGGTAVAYVPESTVQGLQKDNARLRADMRHIVTYVAEPSDLDGDTINALRADLRFVGRVARAALNGKDSE
jgi:hypothetical protein